MRYTYALVSPVLMLSPEDPYVAILAYKCGPQCGPLHLHMTYNHPVNLSSPCLVAGIVAVQLFDLR